MSPVTSCCGPSCPPSRCAPAGGGAAAPTNPYAASGGGTAAAADVSSLARETVRALDHNRNELLDVAEEATPDLLALLSRAGITSGQIAAPTLAQVLQSVAGRPPS